MGNKAYKTGYIFIAINHKDRLVKISAVTNIVSYLNMMKSRYPEYEVIDSSYSVRWNTGLHHKIMKLLQDYRSGTQGEFRTYKLDSYRVQTVIRLLTNVHSTVIGHDVLKCKSCGNEYDADYSEIKDIYKFVTLDLSYCSDDCMPQIAKQWHTSQRYCKCGQIFYPTYALDFYCKSCS